MAITAVGAKAKKTCFVVGPIGDGDSDVRIHSDWLLEHVIRPALGEFPEFDKPVRADQITTPGLINEQIIGQLLGSDLVIADLSHLNPNAFYEIGIRHMVRKPIIHMQLASQAIPFDNSFYRAIKFSLRRPQDITNARDMLLEQIKATTAEGFVVENPVTYGRGKLEISEHATPAQKVLSEEVRSLRADVFRIFTTLERGAFMGIPHPDIKPGAIWRPSERDDRFWEVQIYYDRTRITFDELARTIEPMDDVFEILFGKDAVRVKLVSKQRQQVEAFVREVSKMPGVGQINWTSP